MTPQPFPWPSFIHSYPEHFPFHAALQPWELTTQAIEHITKILHALSADYSIAEGVAIHATAVIENNVTLKPPLIIGPNCFIAANCYLRGGVFLIGHNSIGPGCEIKSSFLFPHSNLAHFNFIGDSVIGSNVNFEAGSITANHHNDKADKVITVMLKGKKIKTGVDKFGALVGDGCKVGANAVLSPGTILTPGSAVKRLQLVDQQKKK